jgi:hypothetical protein
MERADLGRLVDMLDIGIDPLSRFHQACLAGLAADREHAAFYRLLADHATRLIDRYEGVPFPQSTARTSVAELKRLVTLAAESSKGSYSVQVTALHSIAASELA